MVEIGFRQRQRYLKAYYFLIRTCAEMHGEIVELLRPSA